MKKYILICVTILTMNAGVLFAAPKYYIENNTGIVHAPNIILSDGPLSKITESSNLPLWNGSSWPSATVSTGSSGTTIIDPHSTSYLKTIPTSSTLNALAFTRMMTGIATDRVIITESTFSTNYLFTPGAGYTNFWPIEFPGSGTAQIATELWDTAYLENTVKWMFSHQISNATTTYTRPYSSGTDTYTNGVIPSYITPAGVPSFHEGISDKPILTGPFPAIYYVYNWGKSCGYNANWKSWFSANYTKLTAAIDSVPFNGSTGLVNQWSDGYKANGIAVTHAFTGEHLYESILKHQAIIELSYMFSLVGDSTNATTYTIKANTLKAGIQAEFITEPTPLWDYLYEKFTGYARGVGIPVNFIANGSGTYSIIADPNNAKNNLLSVSTTTASGYLTGGPGQTTATIGGPFRGKFLNLESRSYPHQTNAGTYGLFIVGTPGTNVMIVKYSENGHMQYYTGAAWANMPTDRTYTVGWHTLTATINAGWTTAVITIDGLSCGTINLLGATDIRGYVAGVDTASAATIDYDYMRWSNVPTTPDVSLPMGYLPWSNGLDGGNVFSPIATAYAIYTGVLTPSQTAMASRWFNLLYNQPVASGSTAGWGTIFLTVTNQYGPIRWTRWADDYSPGFISLPTNNNSGSWAYGYFVNGGYQHWMPAAILTALDLHDRSTSQAYFSSIMTGINTDSNAPYEKYRVDTGVAEGNLYLHPSISYFEMGNVVN